jgi:hypothetical protein
VVVLTGCSGDADPDSDGTQPAGDEQTTGDVGTITDLDPDFDTGDLPDDYPSDLVPDSFDAGMYAELGTVRNVNFETSSSFDDVVAEYTNKIGEDPILVEGEDRWPNGSSASGRSASLRAHQHSSESVPPNRTIRSHAR